MFFTLGIKKTFLFWGGHSRMLKVFSVIVERMTQVREYAQIFQELVSEKASNTASTVCHVHASVTVDMS